MKRLCLLFCLLLLSIGQAYAGMLMPGQGLSAGQRIYSDNNEYYAQMQGDGNFVVYTATGTALWSTNTAGSGANWAVMQTDGNFVLYNQSTGAAIWSSNTTYKRAGYAGITNYGQWLVVTNVPLWATNTSDHSDPPPGNAVFFPSYTSTLNQGTTWTVGSYRLAFQGDGNLVIYNPTKALWSSNTAGKSPDQAMVAGGFLVIYPKGQEPTTTQSTVYYESPLNVTPQTYSITEWQSVYMAMQADGNLVIYIPHRAFTSPSPYAPPTIYANPNNPGCYGPPDSCMGTVQIYPIPGT